ncbi:50S ribosomal protein L16 [Candidatus Falkowbacteria bacterium]|jgi:large subunit ribosomal protein L16|nr:50S ribosomal protein L16 [Candidatus Falkowbacteria bacterium]MBT5502994.1 50S ribosomal protein L16 [Candidatus Falkowbacteria bacterium]MBT6574350.1 50S ribosomal protein L16 [Candidatus Falkowbacteria bacterium]MBT7349057.1 50S ribosomal protein L16 [Candidatus Falkowbacteria bacterium]MBT7500949.1 50S ribosomal protein L16 [Candidatus Falkowbacteria bacterium]
MLTPKKTKHRKWHKGRGRNRDTKASRATEVSFGQFGLKATTASWVSSRQIEAARRSITRYVKRGGKVWIRIFPDKPVTSKGSQATMGSGKGAPEYFVAVVRPGTVIFELAGVTEEIAKESMRLAGHKLPVKTKFVSRG